MSFALYFNLKESVYSFRVITMIKSESVILYFIVLSNTLLN